MIQPYSYEGGSILKITDVSLVLDETLILKDINLEVKNVVRPNSTTGQIIGFLGPSGRGKTQLFNIISGLKKPTTGTVEVFGKPVTVGDVGVVAQKYPLFMHRTVLGNLEVGAARNKTLTPAERKDKIQFYLERFRISDKANFYPAKLSGGQRQRVAIIQQLLCSENFLLMDEPFSGLDVLMTEEVSETITEVANLSDLNTVIVVTHDFASAAAISNNLWFLGFDFDEHGKPIPGARVKFEENIMDRGFAWQFPEIYDVPEFHTYLRDIRKTFNQL